jgi:hypothetical protein
MLGSAQNRKWGLLPLYTGHAAAIRPFESDPDDEGLRAFGELGRLNELQRDRIYCQDDGARRLEIQVSDRSRDQGWRNESRA